MWGSIPHPTTNYNDNNENIKFIKGYGMCGSRNYRAYDKKGKLMQGIYDIVFCVGGVRVSGTGVYMGNGWAERTDPTKRCDVILMQSICLNDINGTEIFEGDVLHQLDPHIWNPFVVEYSDQGAYYIAGGILSKIAIKEQELVIVGNIHDNPELLEEVLS